MVLGMSLSSAPDLPPTLAQIAEAAGVPAALALAKARGGRTVTIPQRAAGSVLARIVGVEAAEKIIDAFGYGTLEIPFGPFGGERARRIAVMEAIEGGASVSQAAGQCGVHMRTVKRVKRKMREAAQPDLLNK